MSLKLNVQNKGAQVVFAEDDDMVQPVEWAVPPLSNAISNDPAWAKPTLRTGSAAVEGFSGYRDRLFTSSKLPKTIRFFREMFGASSASPSVTHTQMLPLPS